MERVEATLRLKVYQKEHGEYIKVSNLISLLMKDGLCSLGKALTMITQFIETNRILVIEDGEDGLPERVKIVTPALNLLIATLVEKGVLVREDKEQGNEI